MQDNKGAKHRAGGLQPVQESTRYKTTKSALHSGGDGDHRRLLIGGVI